MDKIRFTFVFFSSTVIVLLVAVAYLVTQNHELATTNRSLLASVETLEAKARKLEMKNLELSRVVEENSDLVKNFESQKQSLQDTIDTLKKEVDAIQFEMNKSQAQMNSALEEKTYLEDILIHKTRQIEALKNTNPSQRTNITSSSTDTATSSDISTKIKEKEQEINQLTEQNRVLSSKMDRLYQVTTSKISEINVAKIALEDTVSGAKDKIDEEWNTVNLGSINVDKSDQSPGAAKRAAAPRSGPKTAGKILAINESHGFVVVDLGKVDNLNRNANLEIIRNGKNIANLSVLEIRDVMAACNIKYLENGEKIRVNDAVRIAK